MTNVNVPRGTLIYPFQGTVRMDKLDVFSFLDDTDVSVIDIYTVIYYYRRVYNCCCDLKFIYRDNNARDRYDRYII